MKQSSAAIQIRDDFADADHGSSHKAPGQLEFSRTDLVFGIEAAEIDIALRMRNPAPRRSKRRFGVVEFAEFGAFLPWTPLTTFEVPPLEPGAVTIVRLRVPRPKHGGAGKPPDVELRRGRKRVLAPAELPEDAALFDPQGMGLPAWADEKRPFNFAGNLNVHVDGESVERHCSGPMQMYAGACNAAYFAVGDGSDAYRFAISRMPAGWDVKLQAGRRRLKDIEPGIWYDGATVQCAYMTVIDALWRSVGERFMLNVEQQSTGRVAVVEFEFACEMRERPDRSAYRHRR